MPLLKSYWHALSCAWRWGLALYGKTRHGIANALWRQITLLQAPPQWGEDWFTQLDRPEMSPFVKANPRLAFRPLCPYLVAGWSFARRGKVVLDTYAFIHAHGGNLHQAMLKPQGLLLVEFLAAKDMPVRVHLGFDNQMRKEGEISLSLEAPCFSGCKLAFSLERLDRLQGRWAMMVGSLQGRPYDEEGVRTLTKALYGFRPKAFLVFLAQEIARDLRMAELLGVNNDMQILRGRKPYLLERKKEILFDYDGLWLEMGGEKNSEGWYRLPLSPYRRQGDEIKPNKRSLYAKRYALMDQISRAIALNLAPFKTEFT